MIVLFLAACLADPPPLAPDPCAVARVGAPDLPLSDLAWHRIREARTIGDPGLYTLAEAAADCALAADPDDLSARRARVHVAVQFHEFAAAEADARALAAHTGAWEDWLLVGDAAMEQGRLAEAHDALAAAAASRPGLLVYDRLGWLAWLTGDAEAAREYAAMAASSATAADPEVYAWVQVRKGWLAALAGEPAPEIERALAVLPDYPPARFARGRIRLHAGDPGAADDLRAAGPTVEAVRALAELDPSVDVERVLAQDDRGAGIWLADRDPARAVALLAKELESRRDAQTLLAWAYATHRAGGDARAVAREAVATGILEPRALLHAGIVLGDRALLDRALAAGPGLLPSERALAEAR